MNPVLPGARWSPRIYSRRPYVGQAATDVLTVRVNKDGQPFAGAAIEILLMNGDAKSGVTGADGIFALPYAAAQRGQAVVRLTPPPDVEDIGEGANQGTDLKGGPVEVKFDLVGMAMAAEGSPLVGLGVAGLLYALVLA